MTIGHHYLGPTLEIGIGRAVLYLHSRKARFPTNSKGNIVLLKSCVKESPLPMKTPFHDPSTDESSSERSPLEALGVWTTVGSVVMVEYCHGRGARHLSDRILQTHQRTMNGESSSLDDRKSDRAAGSMCSLQARLTISN